MGGGFRGRELTVGNMISRRNFLKLTGGAVGAACGEKTITVGEAGEASEGQQEAGSAASRGRLLARPAPLPSDKTARRGLRPLGLGSGRDGLLYIPEGYGTKDDGAPLALMLHGVGSNARSGISHFLDLADESGLVLLAPESRGRTWDVLVGYGPDVEFIDRALEQTFDRLAVDAGTLAMAGFSDGASYALSIGLTNGDLFTHVIAFSPGFAAPAGREGSPRIFVSHGVHDKVLPIDRCSRRIVPQLEREGYEVRYREFDGPHTVPQSVAHEALEWFTA